MPNSVVPSRRLTLENNSLSVEVLPEIGGKITSLFAKETATEFLLQPSRDYIRATHQTTFAEADRSGWDECLPTVSATQDVPDHGDLWRGPWHVAGALQGIALSCDCVSRPLRFTRHLNLNGNALHVEYGVENLGAEPVDFLWSAHPLLAVSPGDRIILPASIDRVRINSSRNLHLIEDQTLWPVAGGVDLSVAKSADAGTAEKLFAGPLTSGACGIYRAGTGTGLLFRSHPTVTPYIGIWLCYGGWPENEVGTATAQYAVAIEPTTSPCDSLEQAIDEGTAARIDPDSSLRWTMQLHIFVGSLEDFINLCNRAETFLL